MENIKFNIHQILMYKTPCKNIHNSWSLICYTLRSRSEIRQ